MHKLYPAAYQTAKTTAKALWENFIIHYSFPEQLHSDQGRNFESRVIKELCALANVKKTRTTPYHPMCNGSVERFNQTLLKMLGTLEEDKKADWKTHVGPLVQAYNSTKSDATGYSPHFLMFGWHPRLSVDIFFGIDNNQASAENPSSYVDKLRTRMQYSYKAAAQESAKNSLQQKQRYDRRVREHRLEVGDRVLVRKVGLIGKNKLADKWEQDPYLVIKIPDNEIPVYRVKRENGQGPTRTLHRNFLLAFTSIPPVNPTSKSSHSDIQSPSCVDSAPAETDSCQTSDSDESESMIYLRPRRVTQPTLGSPIPTANASPVRTPQSNRAFSPEQLATPPTVGVETPETPPLRRSERQRRPPDWYGDRLSFQQYAADQDIEVFWV